MAKIRRPREEEEREEEPRRPRPEAIDEFAEGLAGLAELGKEVAELQDAVAGAEAKTLRRLIAHVVPIMPSIDGPIATREDWVNPGKSRVLEEAYYGEPGLTLVNSFASTRRKNDSRWLDYTGFKVILTRGGRLVRLDRSGSFSESGGTVSLWSSEAREIEITPEFASRHLRECVSSLAAAIANASRQAEKGKAALVERLKLLKHVDDMLGRAASG